MNRLKRPVLVLAVLLVTMSVAGAAPLATQLRPAACWVLGDDLSQAALLNESGSDPKNADAMHTGALNLAGELGITLAPLPKTSDKQAALLQVMQYQLAVSRQIESTLGPECSALFKISSLSDFLYATYRPGDQMSLGLAQSIKGDFRAVGLPERLWSDALEAIVAQKPQVQVWQLVAQTHTDVTKLLATETSDEVGRSTPSNGSCGDDLRCARLALGNVGPSLCKAAIEKHAEFGFEWTDAAVKDEFYGFRWASDQHKALTLMGDRGMMADKDGHFQNAVYECDIDLASKSVSNVRLRPGQLPHYP